jgi:murein L,D-transpeptidase YcbB/YkuD
MTIFPARTRNSSRARVFRKTFLSAASVLVVCSFAAGLQGDAQDGPGKTAEAIRRLIRQGAADRLDEQRELERLYAPLAYAALWLDARNEPTADARAAAALFRTAEDHGLRPADYAPRTVDLVVGAPAIVAPASAAAFDLDLSLALLRYYRHVHLGRVNPRAIGFHIDAPDHAHDFVEIVRTARIEHRIAETAAALTPRLPQYEHLRRALREYRTLASTHRILLPFPAATVIRPGDAWPDVSSIRQLLMALGDLEAGAEPDAKPGQYSGPLVDAAERFQRRHGLDVDGILGQRTQAAMTVPLTWRVRQIELALERLRWLPEIGGRPLVAVNIPMFRLWGWDALDRPPAVAMNVVVGRALDTKTPVFMGDLDHVVFRPYWNVPLSIAREELLPAFERDPARFARERFEIVQNDETPEPLPTTREGFNAVRRGAMRLRQQPGATNPLGLIKFIFPNPHDVYMHATPANAVFERSRRDFSHGCVRVEDPVALAVWALNDPVHWTRDQVAQAMRGADDRHIPLPRPVQVLLFYLTAAVTPDDGALHFAEDIYHHDRRLDEALNTGRR